MSDLIIVEDETEIFTRSNCNCDFCRSTHASVNEWDGFTPRTNLQHGMIQVVDRIMSWQTHPERIPTTKLNAWKKEPVSKPTPLRRSPRLAALAAQQAVPKFPM